MLIVGLPRARACGLGWTSAVKLVFRVGCVRHSALRPLEVELTADFELDGDALSSSATDLAHRRPLYATGLVSRRLGPWLSVLPDVVRGLRAGVVVVSRCVSGDLPSEFCC